jgi:hypothetical protein
MERYGETGDRAELNQLLPRSTDQVAPRDRVWQDMLEVCSLCPPIPHALHPSSIPPP